MTTSVSINNIENNNYCFRNPAYTCHTLRYRYFWWRDQGIAENKTELASSLCYLNRMEDLELVFGWGKVALEALRIILKKSGDSYAKQMIADCLAPPLREMKFPRDL